MRRKLAVIATAVLLALSLAACGGRKPTVQEFVEPDFDLSERLTISWLITTQQTVKLTETPAFKHLCEKLNVKIELTEKGTADYPSYKNNQLASGKFADMVSSLSSSEAQSYGNKGMFAELTPYLKYMPNYSALVNSALSRNFDNYAYLYNQEGKMYAVNHYNYDPVPLWDFSYNSQAFGEIMARENIKDLNSWENVERVLLKLKEKYPSSTPVTFAQIETLGIKKPIQLFVESFTGGRATTLNHMGFDPEKQEFIFAPEVPGYREAIEFLRRLYSEDLIDYDYLATDLTTTLAKLRTGGNKAFMTAGYVGGYVGNNSIWRDQLSGYKPLEIPTAPGQSKTYGRRLTNFDDVCTAINWSTLGKNPKKLGRVIRLLDYLYSEEFLEVQWYHSDVTETRGEGDDKTHTYRPEIYDKDATTDYSGIYFPWSLFANFQDLNDERPAPGNPYREYREKLIAPENAGLYADFPNVAFSTSDQKLVNQYNSRIEDYYGSQIARFINGQDELNDASWDNFVQQLKSVGGKSLAELYNKAYETYRKNQS